MATMLHSESRRMYSWWWDSHISPKNSKWLQENLTDMDRNVKAMIKLIEEDADSFARRAEMYYKKRPELMKLVEEFYRTYRALAERYDHATGALRQAHRTMSEAFPNQIPLIMHDESPSSSSSEFGPCTPEMPSPLQVALDSDDLHMDASGASPHFNIRRKFGLFSEENDLLSSKRGLKQLKELFPTGEAVSGQVRKGLNFREEERKTEEKEDFKNEIKRLQDEVSELSSRNENLMNQMATESERARNLEEFIFKLESEKKAALLQYKVSTERLSTLETDIFNTRDELNKVSNEMLMKLTNVEEQCLTMEKMNQSLQFELQNQHTELEKKGRELEELNISIEEEHQKRMQAETALMSFEQMRTHSQEEAKLLILEILSGTEKLKQMELSKAGLEEKIFELNGVIASLREQNISYDVKIMDLQDEIKSLKETKKKLEDGLGLYFEENKNLQQELCSLKVDQINLERRHLGLTEQMEVVSEKNELMENSLSDARFELESLRDKAGALEASCEALLGEVSTHVVEKDVIVSKIEDVSKNMVSLLEKNTLLENSLSDANAELDGLRARYQDLDESCVSLCEKNYSLLIDKNTLVSQLENLENKYLGLQNQLFNLEREKDLTVVRVLDLESLLRLERQEHDALIMSLSTQLASVHKQINLLQEEIQVKEKNLEAEQQKCINSLFEIFILRRCLSEMRDNNLLLSGECQNLLEASKCTEDKISQLELEKLFQKDELKLVSGHNEILREGIHLLSEELGIDVKLESMDSTTVELLLQTILREVKSIQSAISDTRDENQQLHIKVAKLESKHLKLQGEYLSLMMEKDSLVHEVTGLENSLRLEKQQHEALLLSCSSQLTSSQTQIRNLEDEIHIREEEFEVDQQKTMSAHLENLILQTCLCDMKEKNLILSGECWSLLEALRYAEKQICQLEDMELTHKKELSLLSNHNDTVRARIHLLSEELNIDVKYGFKEDATDEALFQAISDEIKHILSSVSDAHDENQRLNLEIPVLVTLIEQIGLDRFHLICELEWRREGLLALESKTSKLRERNEQLSSEKNIVVSQVADLESKHLKLQDQHSSLMTEKNTLVHEVKGLESFLKLEKQEHEALLLSFSSKLVSSQNLIRHLEEEIHIREGDFEVEQLKTMAAHLENIILQRCLYDMKDKNLIISGECWSLLETLRSAEKRICQLEDRELTQTEELSVLLNHNNSIRARIHLLLEALNIDIKHGTKEDAMDEVLLQAILREIRNMLSSVLDAHDENHRLHLEILVLDTVFKQIGLDRYHLICELESRSEELLASKSKTIKLAEINEQLSSEKSILVSQVEIFGQRLKSLETEYSELEHKHTKLEEEKDSVFHQAMELENSLKTDKQESQALILSCKDHLASLESQLSLMQEERRFMVAKFETVQEKLMSAFLDIFILQRCLNDMKDANLILSEECRKLLESYRHSLDIISELEQKQNVQEKDMLLLLNNNDKLRDGVLLLLEELNINVDSEIVGGTKCEELLQTISGEIKALMNSFVNTEEENNCLHLEISVLATLILCTGVEKANLNHELKDRLEEVLFLEKEKDDAVEINKQLKLELHILGEQLSESHEVQQRLQTELCNLVEGNLSWSERFAKLKEEKDALEEENISVLADALTLDHLLIFFKSLCSEEVSNLILLSDDISCLLAVKSNVDEEIRVKNGIIEELEVETVKLKELSVLQGIDINEARNFCEEVCLKVVAGEILLLQKEMEIAELREENADLCRNYERVNKDLDSADQVRNELEKKIQILTLGSVSKDGEITDIMEANRLLRKEQDMLNSELEVLRRREQSLTSALQKGIIDVNKSEGEIETLLNDIHILVINAAVLEEKLFELIIACESLEIFAFLQRDRFSEEIVFKSAFIDELKNKLDDLGVENSTLKANLNAYSSLLLSLFDRIATIEEHIVSLAKLPKRKDDETLGNLKNKKSSHQPSEDNITTVKPELFVSQKLIPKVEALQQVVIDTKNLLEQERLDSNAKLEAARKEIEELKLKEVFLKEISREKYGQTMKDIQLDQVSSSCINPYRLNRIKNSESDDQMLELWETAERDEVEEVKSEYPSSELVAEKELSIDKLEISTRINESPREWAKRFFEKLNYDAKRLSLVRRGLLELKAKLGSLEKRWRPKNPEYSTFKLQLIDFEVALSEQVDFNGKLKKKVEDILGSYDSVIRMEERKQISEEARLGSENVGKLELELQKSEYIFLKVEEEEEKRKIGCVERTSGVLLRDYIYGRRAGKGRWKRPFCGCTRPKTDG